MFNEENFAFPIFLLGTIVVPLFVLPKLFFRSRSESKSKKSESSTNNGVFFHIFKIGHNPYAACIHQVTLMSMKTGEIFSCKLRSNKNNKYVKTRQFDLLHDFIDSAFSDQDEAVFITFDSDGLNTIAFKELIGLKTRSSKFINILHLHMFLNRNKMMKKPTKKTILQTHCDDVVSNVNSTSMFTYAHVFGKMMEKLIKNDEKIYTHEVENVEESHMDENENENIEERHFDESENENDIDSDTYESTDVEDEMIFEESDDESESIKEKKEGNNVSNLELFSYFVNILDKSGFFGAQL